MVPSLVHAETTLSQAQIEALTGGLNENNVRSYEWWIQSLNVDKAWQITKGKNVVVGVVDTGVEATHPDLAGSVLSGTNFAGFGDPTGRQPLNTDPSAFYAAHGTGMSGYIAAHGHGPNNSLGYIGVAPEAKILPVAIPLIGTKDDWDTKATHPDSIAKGIRWAVDHGAKVINMSIGAGNNDEDEKGNTISSAIAYAEAHDVVLVASAGNDGTETLESPGFYPGVIDVSGVDRDYAMDSNSSFGGPEIANHPAKTAHDLLGGVALSAPFSTVNDDENAQLAMLSLSGAGYYRASRGTSDSTAIVSGIAALIRAKYPTMDAGNVVNRLIKTAYHPAGTGYSNKHGFGVVDAYAALTAKVDTICENPLGSLATDSPGVWESVSGDGATYTPQCKKLAAASSTTPAKKSSSMHAIFGLVVALAVIALTLFWLVRSRKRAAVTSSPNPVPAQQSGVVVSSPEATGDTRPPQPPTA